MKRLPLTPTLATSFLHCAKRNLGPHAEGVFLHKPATDTACSPSCRLTALARSTHILRALPVSLPLSHRSRKQLSPKSTLALNPLPEARQDASPKGRTWAPSRPDLRNPSHHRISKLVGKVSALPLHVIEEHRGLLQPFQRYERSAQAQRLRWLAVLLPRHACWERNRLTLDHCTTSHATKSPRDRREQNLSVSAITKISTCLWGPQECKTTSAQQCPAPLH